MVLSIYDWVSYSVPFSFESEDAVLDDFLEKLGSSRIDATINGSVHAQESDDVLEIALHLGSHFGTLALLHQRLNVLVIFSVVICSEMEMFYCFREGHTSPVFRALQD